MIKRFKMSDKYYETQYGAVVQICSIMTSNLEQSFFDYGSERGWFTGTGGLTSDGRLLAYERTNQCQTRIALRAIGQSPPHITCSTQVGRLNETALICKFV